MTRAAKQRMRDLAVKAYERELRFHLAELVPWFEEWQAKRISSTELSDRIHEYHQGPARAVFSNYRQLLSPERKVAWAVANGTLDESEIDAEVLEQLRSSIDAMRQANDW